MSTKQTRIIPLKCLIYGEDPRHEVFTVQVEDTVIASTLRKVIKQERPNLEVFELYKVSITNKEIAENERKLAEMGFLKRKNFIKDTGYNQPFKNLSQEYAINVIICEFELYIRQRSPSDAI